MNCFQFLEGDNSPVEIKRSTLISLDKRFFVKERLNRSFPINLIMRVTKKMGRTAPIKIEQCTLNKFFPKLPNSKEHSLIKKLDQINSISVNKGYTLRMRHDGTIYIKEEYCLDCGRHIVKVRIMSD